MNRTLKEEMEKLFYKQVRLRALLAEALEALPWSDENDDLSERIKDELGEGKPTECCGGDEDDCIYGIENCPKEKTP